MEFEHFHLCGHVECSSEEICDGPQPCGIDPGARGERLCLSCVDELAPDCGLDLT